MTVEGIPVFRNVALFAGRHGNEGLGRFVSTWRHPPPRASVAGDNGCPKAAEEGNVVGIRHHKRMHPSQAREIVACVGDASFARSFDPCTSIPAMQPESDLGLAGQSRWHHGWANLREQEEPALGPSRMDGARLATCHRFREEEAWHERQGWRSRPPSLARIARARVGLPARRIVVAEVGRRRLASNTLGKRAPKRAAGSSEQGSSSEGAPVGDTAVAQAKRNDDRASTSPRESVEDRR